MPATPVTSPDPQHASPDPEPVPSIPLRPELLSDPRQALAPREVYEIRCAWLEGQRQQQLARRYGVAQSAVSKLITGSTYRWVPTPVLGSERLVSGPVALPWRDILDYEQAVALAAVFVDGWHLARPRPQSMSVFVDWLANTPDEVVDAVCGLPYRATGRPLPTMPTVADLEAQLDAAWCGLRRKW